VHIIRNDPAKAVPATGAIFTGPVSRTGVVEDAHTDQLRIGLVRFEAGGRNVFHTHTFDQVLYVTEGEGIVATEQEEHRIRTGDAVVIPAGEKHWHGATPTTAMAHLAIGIPGQTQIST
jgi:quercetin dioxygenase-like cupin family protein